MEPPDYSNQPPAGPVKRWLDRHLEQHADHRARQWAAEFSALDDGKQDDGLAYRIRREVQRRGAIGRQLDIHEPLRWTGISFVLSAALAAGIKAGTDKHFSRPALITLLMTTGLTSAIQLVRLFPRYDAGLRGGVDTALAMHEFDRAHTTAQPPQGGWQRRIAPDGSPEWCRFDL